MLEYRLLSIINAARRIHLHARGVPPWLSPLGSRERVSDAGLKRPPRDDLAEIEPEIDQGARDVGTDSREHDLRAQKPGCAGRPDKPVRHLGVHLPHAGDIED